jgi:hypothetical protein
MNLPFILDVALGLMFIYLILSLLASEVQELITTVFQWRAQHLRRAIEILIGGDVPTSEDLKVIKLANQIYDNPLIRSINQEAKGLLATLPRKFTWATASLYRSFQGVQPGFQKNATVFGDSRRSGPSYIPASNFAGSFLDTLELPTLVQKLTESRLDKFKAERLNTIQDIVFKLQEQANTDEKSADFFNKVYQEFAEIQADYEQIAWNFQQGKANIITSMNRMGDSLDRYIESFQIDMPNDEIASKALRQLKFLKKDSFADVEQSISLGGLRPNATEVVQLINKGSAVYQEFTAAIQDKDNETYQKLHTVIDKLPPKMAENLTTLAQRVQTNIQTTEEGIHTLKQQVETVFDGSMERAGGVYKRNAKGVAILIGFSIAVAANADAFHMVNRLSKDSALRDTITRNAGQIVMQNSGGSIDLEVLRSQADEALTDISLPIGWTEINLQQQLGWSPRQPFDLPIFKIIRVIPGWILSGIAIAMGAPFWFDLLGKVVNVRNTGKPPGK